MQSGADGDPRRAEPLGERVAAHAGRNNGQHAGLIISLREKDAQPRQFVQPRGKTVHQPFLHAVNALRCSPPDEADALAQAGNAANIVRSGFQSLGQGFRHEVTAAVTARPAG